MLKMISMAPEPDGPAKAPAKRSLFARPSWSKIQDLGSSDLFHRSNQTYVASAAEAERRRQGKLAKKEKERAQQSNSEERESKRQRICEDDDDGGDGSDDDDGEEDESCTGTNSKHTDANTPANVTIERNIDRPNAPPSPPKSIATLVENYQKKFTERTSKLEKKCPYVPEVINLEDGDDESYHHAAELPDAEIVERAKASKPEEEEAMMSDEEFPELAKKAREKAGSKRLEQSLASPTPDLPSSSELQMPYISPPSARPTAPEPDLQILITCSIPDTTPLIVSRKLGQRLKDVRLAWIDKQQLSSVITDDIFLVWRGKRLFDVTTCRSLGITVDPDGRVIAKGGILGEDEGRIHMEAMTSKILEERRRAKAEVVTKAEELKAGHGTRRSFEDKAEEDHVKIILKARGFEDFKLRVKPVNPPLYCIVNA